MTKTHLSTRLARLAALALLCAAGMGATGCAELLQRAADASSGPAPEVHMTADEAQIFAMTNEYRKENGLPALKMDARLVGIARMRSRDMAARNYFSHVTPEGDDVFSQMHEARVNYWAAGENLARNNFPADLYLGEAMNGWRKSPEHRANMLHPAFGKLGVGVARAVDGKRYITEVFTD